MQKGIVPLYAITYIQALRPVYIVIFISLFYLGVLMALSWREGEIKEIVEDGETKVKVFFSGRIYHIHHSMGFPLNLNAQMSILLPRGG